MIFEKEKSNGGKKTAQKFYLFILIIWYEKKTGFVESSESLRAGNKCCSRKFYQQFLYDSL